MGIRGFKTTAKGVNEKEEELGTAVKW